MAGENNVDLKIIKNMAEFIRKNFNPQKTLFPVLDKSFLSSHLNFIMFHPTCQDVILTSRDKHFLLQEGHSIHFCKSDIIPAC